MYAFNVYFYIKSEDLKSQRGSKFSDFGFIGIPLFSKKLIQN